jgi:putative flippase GtrA
VLLHFSVTILVASAISFIRGTIGNYLLCCVLVFRSGRFSRHIELLRIFGIAIVGLALNTAVLWLRLPMFSASTQLSLRSWPPAKYRKKLRELSHTGQTSRLIMP